MHTLATQGWLNALTCTSFSCFVIIFLWITLGQAASIPSTHKISINFLRHTCGLYPEELSSILFYYYLLLKCFRSLHFCIFNNILASSAPNCVKQHGSLFIDELKRDIAKPSSVLTGRQL